MKKIIFLLIAFAMTLSLSTQEKRKLEFPTHEIYNQFAGEWTMIYANLKEGKTLASGRGESVSKLDMRNTVLEFRNEFEHKIGQVISKYIIGYDVLKKGYYLITYSSVNESPVIMFGKYDKDEKSFIFKSNIDSQKEGDVKSILKLDREDKITFKSYVLIEGEESLFLNVGFIKK